MPSPVFALTGWSAWKSPSAAAVFICSAMWPCFSRSTLLTTITTGTPSSKTRRATKRSPAPIRSRALTTSSDDVEVVAPSSRRRGSCIRSVSGSIGLCQPGRSTSTSCASSARADAADAVARRVRDARDDRDLLAGERVDERRLADVRAARRRRRSRTSSGQVPGVGQQLGRRRGAELAVVGAVADLADPELVEPLPAAAARRGGDPDRLEVARAGSRPSTAATIAVFSAQTPSG